MNTSTQKTKSTAKIPRLVGLCLATSLLLFTGCKQEEKTLFVPGQLTISHSIDKESIRIGDRIKLTLIATFPTNGIVELPELGREKDLVQLKRDWEKLTPPEGYTQTKTTYSLTSFRLGQHRLTTQPILYRHNGQIETNQFPEINITVESSLEAEASTTIADIKEIHNLPGRIPPWLWLSLLVVLIAFVVGWLTSTCWKKRSAEKPAPPPIPPHIIARQALNALQKSGLLEQNECNHFYTELSLILRTYLEGRFHLNAPDETTDEIVEEMTKSPELNGTQRNILQDFMRQADMVKFAKGHPDRATMESAFSTTAQFVEETAVQPEPSNMKPEPS